MRKNRIQLGPILVALAGFLCAAVAAQDARRGFTIQIAAVSTEEDAAAIVAAKRAEKLDARIARLQPPGRAAVFRVRIGRFVTRQQAERAARELVARGSIAEFFITEAEASPPPAAAAAPRNNVAQVILGGSSWSLFAALREVARPPANPNVEIAGDVLKLVARSANAATDAMIERANSLKGLSAFRHAANGYAYYRPQYWRESEVSVDTLREEKIRSGEMFVSPEAGAFLSSAWRTFEAGPDGLMDGAAPVSALTPEILIEKMMRKLRKLPGVSEARELRYSVLIKEGIERTEVELELTFRPNVDEPPLPFLGRAVLLRNAAGVFELIGLRQRQSAAIAAQLIDRAIASARLTSQ
jgi:hypothetical protein